MYQNLFRLGLCHRLYYWGSLQHSPRPPSWNEGDLLLREEGAGRKRQGEGGEGTVGEGG